MTVDTDRAWDRFSAVVVSSPLGLSPGSVERVSFGRRSPARRAPLVQRNDENGLRATMHSRSRCSATVVDGAEGPSTIGGMPSRAPTPARRYTQTRVPSLDTQLEIKVMLEDARDIGLSEPEWHALGEKASVLHFRIDGRPCQVMLRPDADEGDPEAELRRLHRVLLHFMKNAIEAGRSGLLRVGEALLAFHVTLALPEAKAPATPTRALTPGPVRRRGP